MQYGRDGKSWFHHLRDLDRAYRDACTLVLSKREIADSTWSFDITGSPHFEVHSQLVVADNEMLNRFRSYGERVVREPAAQCAMAPWSRSAGIREP